MGSYRIIKSCRRHFMMMNTVELASRPAYRLFLQSLLVLVKSAPRAQTGVIIAAARAFLGATWALALGALVLAMIVMRGFILRKLETQQATLQTEHKEKVNELEEQLAVGREERSRLKESSDVVVNCVRALQTKLQSETQIREQFVETATLDKASQNKKLDTLIERLNSLKSDLKEGIVGMENSLRSDYGSMAGDN